MDDYINTSDLIYTTENPNGLLDLEYVVRSMPWLLTGVDDEA